MSKRTQTSHENAQPERKMQTLKKEQAQTLLEEARGHPLETLLILALLTGMRRGELVALHWQDINLDEHMLQVRRSARRVAKQGVILSALKTPASRRTIFLSPLLVEVLNRHRASQEAMRLAAGPAWTEQNLVFCNARGGYLNTESVGRDLRSILRKAGLPQLRFHDLRSSTATLLLALDVHPQIIRAVLGHSAMPMFSSLHLQPHIFRSLQQEAMNKLSDLFRTSDKHKNGDALPKVEWKK